MPRKRKGEGLTQGCLKDERWPLFIPGASSEKIKRPNLSSIYHHIISCCTMAAPNSKALESKMLYLVKQHLLEKRKDLARKLAAYLNDSEHYHQLLKLNHFLFAYLTCAGLPLKERQGSKPYLHTQNYITRYESYANKATLNTPFPVPAELFHMPTFHQVFKNIHEWIKSAATNEAYREQVFNSPLQAYIQLCQWHIYQIEWLNDLKTAQLTANIEKKNNEHVSQSAEPQHPPTTSNHMLVGIDGSQQSIEENNRAIEWDIEHLENNVDSENEKLILIFRRQKNIYALLSDWESRITDDKESMVSYQGFKEAIKIAQSLLTQLGNNEEKQFSKNSNLLLEKLKEVNRMLYQLDNYRTYAKLRNQK